MPAHIRLMSFEILHRCNSIPSGCNRCDDVCAKRDGKSGKDDYWEAANEILLRGNEWNTKRQHEILIDQMAANDWQMILKLALVASLVSYDRI